MIARFDGGQCRTVVKVPQKPEGRAHLQRMLATYQGVRQRLENMIAADGDRPEYVEQRDAVAANIRTLEQALSQVVA